MTTKDKIILYLYNKSNRLEDEKQELREARRFRPMDSLDVYEQLRAEIRNEAFSEYISDLISLIVYDYPQKKD